MDRYLLCSELQVFIDADGQPVNSCCHVLCQCLAALPGSEIFEFE